MDELEAERLYRLERKVDFLFRRLGIDPEAAFAEGDELPPSFYEALAGRKLLQAIKIYRDVTGADLRTAKNIVEAMAGQDR